MAITQISRIQQRRGKANSGTGLPQLASGELAWAIDTQQLFIGNGAVSEGAPVVGNTRLLTELDLEAFEAPASLFGQLSYVYKASGAVSSFAFSNGSGYTNGVYKNVQLVQVSTNTSPLTYPTVNLTIVNGEVTVVDMIFYGSGILMNTIFTVPTSVIGNGTGFTLTITGLSNETGPTIAHAVKRSLQSRLDDRVNTQDFGTVGDGIVDDTEALQNAIDDLYLNTIHASDDTGVGSRVVLDIPAGTYNISDSLYIPSYAVLSGSGIDNTIINYNPVVSIIGSITVGTVILNTASAKLSMIGATVLGTGIQGGSAVVSVIPGVSLTISQGAYSTQTNQSFTVSLVPTGPVIQLVNDESSPGSPSDAANNTSLNQPRNITIKNLTISTEHGAQAGIGLYSVRNSIFENVKITGNWLEASDNNSIGILMTANSALVTCENNIFNNIIISSFTYGIFSDNDIINSYFNKGYISDVKYGFMLGLNSNGATVGQQFGSRQSTINNYKFYNVKWNAIYIGLGSSNNIDSIVLRNVGNDGGSSAVPLHPQIYIGTRGNMISNVISDRKDLLLSPNNNAPYIPELAGHGDYHAYGSSLTVTNNEFVTKLFRLPVSFSTLLPTGVITYEIAYTYVSTINDFSRSGTITITADIPNKRIQTVDEYNYVGNEDFNTAILFKVNFLSQTNQITTTSTPYGLVFSYFNALSDDNGTFTYSYTARS
jgi:hypothetical protein